MKVLGIETSCDETAAAVVADGRQLLSSAVASQVSLHARYGGVVPEVASRQHLLAIVPTLFHALADARLTLQDIDAIAVTMGPGLPGSLLVGLNLAKALALSLGLPLVGVNHLEAHAYALWLEGKGEPPLPLLCLLVSGGHTEMALMHGHGQFQSLGRTRDDAAGEAFDKAARMLGLGYPGGPAIDRAARRGQPRYPLPRAWLPGSYDFSFSGLKTALWRWVHQQGGRPEDLAASFQEAVVEVLAGKASQAAAQQGAMAILVAGGVAANRRLREAVAATSPVPVLFPSPALCTDNAAMVAACGYFRLQAGQRHGPALDIAPNLKLG
ncbi:MAG: tRNA (adenosine(37)-N6)-threonylcarbamoyltransferase complex transferase subunit TsaD [Chloroflexota bacterium]